MAKPYLTKRRAEAFEAEAAAAKAAEPVVEEAPQEPVTGPTLTAPMGGRVIEVNVKPGDKVGPKTVLLVYEAMKMENDVTAERDAVVKRIFVKPGDVVGTDALLVEFEG